MPNRLIAIVSALAGASVLTACVTAPPAQIEAPVPHQWNVSTPGSAVADAAEHTALAHGGSVQQLVGWWGRWNDPLLADLVAAAQQASPTLANAAARIAQARAGAVGTASAMLPHVDAQAGVQRTPASTQSIPGVPSGTVVQLGQAGVQLQWELDVFGGLRHADRAAQARLASAQAQWHDARVSLAADTANQYFALRACQANLALSGRDAASRADTATLTGHLTRAGFAAPAALALTQAGAAQAQAQRQQTEAQCTAAIKALVALTAMDEDTLRQRLMQPAGQPPVLAVDNVPARVLDQRPDVFAAAQAIAAASGDVGQADAQRYPRLGLNGNIGRVGVSILQFDTTTYSSTWSVGPLSLTVPLFDGGRRKAGVQASKAQYEAAASQYRATVRNAVREVETALNDLYSARQRSSQTDAAVRGFEKAFVAANAKYKAGMGSMLELEDARRSYLQAQMAQAALQQQTRNAAVALYRALGGGWQTGSNPTTADRDMVAAGEAARHTPQAPLPCQAATGTCAQQAVQQAQVALREGDAAAAAAQSAAPQGYEAAAQAADRAVAHAVRECGSACEPVGAAASAASPNPATARP